jgi:hypothetical protein
MIRSPYVHDSLDDDDDAFDAAFDGAGLLRDGKSTRVPMLLRDGSTVELEDWQREVIYAHRVGLSDGQSLHRPGPRYCTDEAALDAKAQAYAEDVKESTEAWRKKPAANAGSGEFRGQQPGDQCTINGQPGHLNHRLECVPDKPADRQDSISRTLSFDEAQQRRDAAYEQDVRESESAWRRPG